MKIKVLAILTVVAVLHLVVLGVISLAGGCRHPEVLQPRGNVPPPAEEPGEGPAFVPEKEAVVVPPPVATPKVNTEFKPEFLKHTVKANDSLWKIARMYGVSTGELAAENKIEPTKVLKVGTVLTIPPGGSLIPPEKLSSATKEGKEGKGNASPAKGVKGAANKKSAKGDSLPADGTYVVKANDSLWKIAVKYGLRSKDIADANKIDPKKELKIGQKLILPTSGSSVSKKAPSTTTTTTTDVTTKKTEAVDTGANDLEGILKEDQTKKETVTETTTPSGTKVKKEETITDTETLTTPAAAPASKDFIPHETTEGETLESISALYGFTVDDILALNPGLTKNGKIPPFTKLKIPRAK